MNDLSPDGSAIAQLLTIMAKLRDPNGGCPWDLEQDFASIAPYTIEEAYEVADAIGEEDFPALKDELGDLLLQVVFHARMAEEAGHFAFEDVAQAIADKMVRRHPHVFGTDRADMPEQVTTNWEAIKAAERAEKAGAKPSSHLDGVALALPALLRAAKLQKRAAAVGFDWPDAQAVLSKVDEELEETKVEVRALAADPSAQSRAEEEIGDLLFVLANLARKIAVDPEVALRKANAKFERRFHAIEAALEESGLTLEDCDLETLEGHWQAAKQAER